MLESKRTRCPIKIFIVDIILGIHAKIPLCCILFFLKEQIKGTIYIALTVTERRGDVWDPYNFKKPQYVECNKCYAKTKAGLSSHHSNICWCDDVDSPACRFVDKITDDILDAKGFWSFITLVFTKRNSKNTTASLLCQMLSNGWFISDHTSSASTPVDADAPYVISLNKMEE